MANRNGFRGERDGPTPYVHSSPEGFAPKATSSVGAGGVLVNDPDFTLYVGDVLEQLRELPAESVHCVVTSPPYWGLRDYGTGSWDGGDPDCDHLGEPFRTKAKLNENWGAGFSDVKNAAGRQPMGATCSKCGATRTDQQLGLEATPDLFVTAMVAVFREVRRVLRGDGTCWVNLGDSYANPPASGTAGQWNGSSPLGQNRTAEATAEGSRKTGGTIAGGLKQKDLCGIPWRVAFALQTDGWYLRSDIVWAKPNPMPESVTDRPTKAHEYVFLLTRSPRYFFDADAVREAYNPASLTRYNTPKQDTGPGARQPGGDLALRVNHKQEPNPAGRNVRSVWEIATQPFPEAHFATFPEVLPERCIKAGTSERGCCPVCGAPWERETTSEPNPTHGTRRPKDSRDPSGYDAGQHWNAARTYAGTLTVTTTGWRPSCAHTVEGHPVAVPCTVLDPFMGSGTTALVARRLGRRSIGIELNPDYAALCARRLQQLSLFGEQYELRPSPPLERARGLTGGAYNPPGQSPHSNAREPKP